MPALLLTVFVDLIGFGIVLPLQPFYAVAFGAGASEVTLVAASYTAMQFVFAPIWGRLSDRVGRKPILLLTLAGSAVGYVGLAWTDSLATLFVARAFGGAMAGNIGVAHAYAADLVGPSARARGMGRLGAAAGLGFVAGPALGGLLSGPDAADPDFRLPFLFAGGMAAAAFLLALALLRESTSAAARRGAKAAGGWRDPWRRARDAGLAPLLLLVFAMPLVFAGVETVLALWSAQALGWGPARNGYLYSFMGAVAVVVQGLAVGPIVDRLREHAAIVLGTAAAAAGCLILPFSDAAVPVAAGLGLLVFGISVCNPSLNALIAEQAAAHERGALMGVSQSAGGLGRILGPALSGAAFGALGPDWPFLLGAAVMGSAVCFAFALMRRRPGYSNKKNKSLT